MFSHFVFHGRLNTAPDCLYVDCTILGGQRTTQEHDSRRGRLCSVQRLWCSFSHRKTFVRIDNHQGLDATQACQVSQGWCDDQPSAPCLDGPDEEQHPLHGKTLIFCRRGGCTTDGSNSDTEHDRRPSQKTQPGNAGSPRITPSSKRRPLMMTTQQVTPDQHFGGGDSIGSSRQTSLESDGERFRQETGASVQSASSSLGPRSPRRQLLAGRRKKVPETHVHRLLCESLPKKHCTYSIVRGQIHNFT